MNRLIIVGNGFDLAHGLKTSYCDFLTDYLTNAIDTFNSKFHYSDELLEIVNTYSGTRAFFNDWDKSKVFDVLKDLQRSKYTNVVFKSSLLEGSLQKADDLKWVDLENDYYDDLLKIVRIAPLDIKLINKLNSQFNCLKLNLEKYLCNIRTEVNPDFNILELLHGPIVNPYEKESFIYPENIQFLNFNYTKTLERYKDYRPRGKKLKLQLDGYVGNTINHIHGELKSDKNPIIFGFGDEYDEDYIKFENLKKNEVFKHIKSFGYLQTTNYQDLLRFLALDSFEVFIVGHSCGVSDRTMFRTIFEHTNCQSVKAFYYQRPNGSDDFLEKTYELARHFTNKGMMRRKIVSKPLTQPLPQHTQP